MSSKPKPPKRITSTFAILDVMKGRKRLLRAIHPPASALGASIPVTITGHIVNVYGADDGISREFEVTVTKVELG